MDADRGVSSRLIGLNSTKSRSGWPALWAYSRVNRGLRMRGIIELMHTQFLRKCIKCYKWIDTD